MIATPLLARAFDAGSLDSPEDLLGRFAAIGDANARFVHLLSEGVQDTYEDDTVRPAVEAGVDRGGNLMTNIPAAAKEIY